MTQAAEIVVEKLTKDYGTLRAVDQISFVVPKGQVVGFLGPNGAGKSTTIRMLTCYLPPTGGTATVAGHDIFFDSLAVREKVGYLPESAPVYTDMRVCEYLDFKARLRGMDRAKRQQRVDYVLDRCWLKDRRNSLIATLSKGYRQRVGIADALLHNPPVVVLDEPTVGLDPAQIREARKLIGELAGDHTVLLSTHILQEVELICQRVIVIARGKIVAQGTPEELKLKLAEGTMSPLRLVVDVRGPQEQVSSALAAMPGVTHVEVLSSGAACRLAIRGQAGADLRERVAQMIIQRGWALREMKVEGATLEEFFVQITDPAAIAAA